MFTSTGNKGNEFIYHLKIMKKMEKVNFKYQILDNTRPFLHSSIVSFWITPACSKERKYHIFRQYWYTKNNPVFTNTGTFQYLGPEVYFFQKNIFIYFTQITKHLTFIFLRYKQARSQPHSPGWTRVPLSSFFLKFWSIFLILPQNLLIFSSFWFSGWDPGRPWLRHWL